MLGDFARNLIREALRQGGLEEVEKVVAEIKKFHADQFWDDSRPDIMRKHRYWYHQDRHDLPCAGWVVPVAEGLRIRAKRGEA